MFEDGAYMDYKNTFSSQANSDYFERLKHFYRPWFPSDDALLNFFHQVFEKEPAPALMYMAEVGQEGDRLFYILQNGERVSDTVFIPRRMVNTVERLVSAAHDMERIRPGKDIFKLIYLVTCVETLQKLSGSKSSKRKMFIAFFEENVDPRDKAFISEHFECFKDSEQLYEWVGSGQVKGEEEIDPFKQFLKMLHEYRNSAVHEGKYWDHCFPQDAEYPLLCSLDVDFRIFEALPKKERIIRHKVPYGFRISFTYLTFEKIFIRTCIIFIQKYMKRQENEHDVINCGY